MKGCSNHVRRLVALNLSDGSEQYLAEIEIYTNQIEGHRRELQRILQYSTGTRKLVSLTSAQSYLP